MAKPKKNIPANDNISNLLGKIDPSFIDSDDYFDIVQWNLRWFNNKEPDRVDKVTKVLSVLNSDIFVFQEIAEGSLDVVAEKLNDEGKGTYEVKYGTTGGQQRVAFMYDTEWVRRKDEVTELFGKGNVNTPSGKDVFPRLPLWCYYYCKSTLTDQRGFDFQLVGLHLKSQLDMAGKGEDDLQRTLASSKLANWLVKDADILDADTILLGDWNEPPKAAAWKAMRNLEDENKIEFESINDATNFSHLYYRNKNDVGSLLDLRVVTSPFATKMNQVAGGTIRWITLDQLIQNDASAGELKTIITQIKNEVSDHLPVLTRFGVEKKNKNNPVKKKKASVKKKK
jgi:hypothetical protein